MSKPSVENLLADHTPPIRAIAERLRSIVTCELSGLEERVYPGWHAIGYVHPEAGYFGAIFPRATVVKLCFEWGAALPDPDRVLTGNQKRIRYIEIRDEEEIPERSIVVLLGEAIRYQLEMR